MNYKLVLGILWLSLGLWLMFSPFAFDAMPVWLRVAHCIAALVWVGTAEKVSNWLEGV